MKEKSQITNALSPITPEHLKALQDMRAASGVTLIEIGKKCGCSISCVHKILNGSTRQTKPNKLKCITEALSGDHSSFTFSQPKVGMNLESQPVNSSVITNAVERLMVVRDELNLISSTLRALVKTPVTYTQEEIALKGDLHPDNL